MKNNLILDEQVLNLVEDNNASPDGTPVGDANDTDGKSHAGGNDKLTDPSDPDGEGGSGDGDS